MVLVQSQSQAQLRRANEIGPISLPTKESRTRLRNLMRTAKHQQGLDHNSIKSTRRLNGKETPLPYLADLRAAEEKVFSAEFCRKIPLRSHREIFFLPRKSSYLRRIHQLIALVGCWDFLIWIRTRWIDSTPIPYSRQFIFASRFRRKFDLHASCFPAATSVSHVMSSYCKLLMDLRSD